MELCSKGVPNLTAANTVQTLGKASRALPDQGLPRVGTGLSTVCVDKSAFRLERMIARWGPFVTSFVPLGDALQATQYPAELRRNLAALLNNFNASTLGCSWASLNLSGTTD